MPFMEAYSHPAFVNMIFFYACCRALFAPPDVATRRRSSSRAKCVAVFLRGAPPGLLSVMFRLTRFYFNKTAKK